MYQSQSQQQVQQMQILVRQQQRPQNNLYVVVKLKVFFLLVISFLATLSSSLSLRTVKQHQSKQLRMSFVPRTTTTTTTTTTGRILKRSRISSSSQLYFSSSSAAAVSSCRNINKTNRYLWLHQQQNHHSRLKYSCQSYQHSSKMFLSSSSSDYDSNLNSNFDINRNKNNNNQQQEQEQYQQIYTNKLQQLKETTKLSLAPMMDYTDRHFRYLVRLISEKTLLYTEMVPANAISRERQIKINELQHNNNNNNNNNNNMYDMSYIQRFIGQATNGEGSCVLQLGGSDPQQLYEATKCVVEASERSRNNNIKNNQNNNDSLLLACDYTGINLNCGCPSPKVANKGCFGAALMDEPHLVAKLVQSIHDGCSGTIPVTVKCRIGTDSNLDSTFTKLSYNNLSQQEEEKEYKKLCNFINIVSESGIVTDYQIHARIAVLSKSFSPADNRKVPPLKYNIVHQLVNDYPHLTFTLNGGIETLSTVQDQFITCPKLAGIMIGRAWAADPWRFAMTDSILYNNDEKSSPKRKYNNRYEILQQYGKHADYEEEMFTSIVVRRFLTKAITTLFTGEPNSKQYRIELDTITRNAKLLASEQHASNNNNNNSNSNPNNVCTSTFSNFIIKDKDHDLHNIPVSQLILDAATKHLSEEVLFRTPEESYERILWEEDKQRKQQQQLFVSTAKTSSSRSSLLTQSYSFSPSYVSTTETTTTTTTPSTSSTTISLSSSSLNSDDETDDSSHSQSNTNDQDDDNNNNENNNLYQWNAVAEWQKERKEEQKKNNNMNSIW